MNTSLSTGTAKAAAVPAQWYNIIADLPFELPADIPQRLDTSVSGPLKLQLPLALARQTISRERMITIPAPVRERYMSWRPTPLVRASRLERRIGTGARIYFKYEGGNISGSHKLCTALAQAYYYSAAGARRLVTGTGAGQWGTALAAACREFGLECKVYMVGRSYREKPYRKVIMELSGAEVVASPSVDTLSGRELLQGGGLDAGNIAFAVTEALEDAVATPGTQLSVGSGEAYSILHSTVIGIEARNQLAEDFSEEADIVIGSLGAGSNFGGIALPFLRDKITGAREVRCISVEPQGCPKLTKGRYAYDYTDGSGITPLQKMYTLGSQFRTAGRHVGGLRYHACSKIISALRHHGLVEPMACSQSDVFASAILFFHEEGILPAPESAHAVHVAIEEAKRADRDGRVPVILFCLSGHGLFDLSAYAEQLAGTLDDVSVTDEEIRLSLEKLPQISELDTLDDGRIPA